MVDGALLLTLVPGKAVAQGTNPSRILGFNSSIEDERVRLSFDQRSDTEFVSKTLCHLEPG